MGAVVTINAKLHYYQKQHVWYMWYSLSRDGTGSNSYIMRKDFIQKGYLRVPQKGKTVLWPPIQCAFSIG